MSNANPSYALLGRFISQGRLAAGMETQADLAARLSVSQQTVSRWEAGSHRPRPNQIGNLAKMFGFDANDMMGAAGYSNPVVNSFAEPFPVDRLDPVTFEQFVAYLIAELYPDAEVRRLGGQGHDQAGLDVLAQFAETGQTMGFQCKRVSQFGPSNVREVVRALDAKVDKAVLVLSRVASPQTAEAVREYPGWSLWDKDDLSRLARQKLSLDQQIRLVDIFFKGQRRVLLGVDEPGPWMTADEFFVPFKGLDRPFTHDWALVAREKEVNQLVDFAGSDTSAVFLSAAGGMGKSKVLRDACEAIGLAHPHLAIRFLSSSGEADRKALDQLGGGSTLIIIDDAHDRDSVGDLFEYAANPENKVKVILATRPYALGRLKNQAARFGFTNIQNVTLDTLTTVDLEALGRQVLPEDYADDDTLKRLVRFAGDSPLVVAMAARVISSEHIPLIMISDDATFRTTILSRFSKVIAGDFGFTGSEKVHRAVMEVLALVQPFHTDDPQLHQLIHALRDVSIEDISRILRRLVDGGIVFKRGHQYRLMPDVLGDYLLDDACLDTHGKLSPFALGALDGMPHKLLPNALVNLGRLDWRRRDGETATSSLLARVWKSFETIESEYDPRFAAIEAVAVYQPHQALEFVRSQALRGRHLRQLPNILKKISHSGEALADVIDVLWILGRNDDRPLNNNLSHPIRVITDMATYDIRKPLLFSEAVLDFALKLCDLPDAWAYTYTPLTLLEPLLSAEGLHHSSTRRTFSIEPFLIPYETVAPYRRLILDKLYNLLRSPNPRIAFEAARFVEIAVRPIWGRMGQHSPKEHHEPYNSEADVTLTRVHMIVRSGIVPLAAVELRTKLHPYARGNKSRLATKIRKIFAALPTGIDVTLCEAVHGKSHERIGDPDWAAYEARLRQWIDDHVRAIINTYPDVGQRLSAIEAINDDLLSARASPEPYQIIHALCRADESFVSALCQYALDHPHRPLAEQASLALGILTWTNADLAEQWFERFRVGGGPVHAIMIAKAFCHRETISDAFLGILSELVAHTNGGVACAAIYALATLRSVPITAKVEILLNANIDGRSDSADHLALALCGPERDVEKADLNSNSVSQLLAKFVDVPELKGHWINKLLADLSFHYPHETFTFFRERVEASLTPDADVQIANHGRWQRDKLRFVESVDFPELARDLWEWLVNNSARTDFKYAATELFEAIMGHDTEAQVQFFTPYLDYADHGQLRLISRLLRQAHHEFVFDQVPFAIRFLERCLATDTKLYDQAVSELVSSAISGGRSGTPGQPFPRDIEDRDRSIAILNNLSKLSPAYELYDSVLRHAESSIARWREDDEVDDD